MGKSLTKIIPLPDIIKRYSEGESVQDLARESRSSRETIYAWMLGGLGAEQYESLVTRCLTNRIADADQRLATGSDMSDIVRAREMAKFSRMDLERRRPHLYGMRTGLSIDNQIHVTVHREKKRKAQPVDVKPLVQDLSITDVTPT